MLADAVVLGAGPEERIRRALGRLSRRGAAPPYCASAFYNDNAAALRVPRRSLDSAGVYERRLDLIEELVQELIDVDDGRPVIAAVTRPASECTGGRVSRLPNLLLHFRTNICSRAVRSARLGDITAPPPDNIRSGNHQAGGFAFAVGPAAADAPTQVKSMEGFASLAEKLLTAGP
jgi:hypothetical protein